MESIFHFSSPETWQTNSMEMKNRKNWIVRLITLWLQNGSFDSAEACEIDEKWKVVYFKVRKEEETKIEIKVPAINLRSLLYVTI